MPAGQRCLPQWTAAQPTAFGKKLGPRSPMDRATDSIAAEQRDVRGIDDRIDPQADDVPQDKQMRTAISGKTVMAQRQRRVKNTRHGFTASPAMPRADNSQRGEPTRRPRSGCTGRRADPTPRAAGRHRVRATHSNGCRLGLLSLCHMAGPPRRPSAGGICASAGSSSHDLPAGAGRSVQPCRASFLLREAVSQSAQ